MCSAPATRSTCPSPLVAALAALLLASSPAAAATLYEPRLGVGAEVRYDSDAQVGGGSDLMSKLSPKIGGRLRNELRELEAGYGPELIHHADGGNFTLDHRATLAWRERLSRRLRLKLDGSFFRVSDTSSLPRFGIAHVRAGALWMVGDLSGTYELSRKTALEAGYRAEATRLIAAGYPLGAAHAFGLQLREALSRRFMLGGRYRYQLFASGSTRQADSHTVDLTARWRLLRHTSFTLEAGPLLYRSTDSGDTLDLRLKAQLEHAARGVDLGLAAGRDYLGAAGYANAIWSEYAQAALTWRLSLPLSLLAAAGIYRNGTAPSGKANAVGYGLSAGVEYRFSRGLAVGGGYDRIGQIGLGEQRGLTMARNILSVRLSYRME